MNALIYSNRDHILLTRFNLPSRGYESIIRAREGWLRERMRLFEKYCLPSVQNQTRKPSGWIIYFDPESPTWLVERISAVNSDELFHPIFRAEVSRAELMEDIESFIGKRKDFLLTTNLDNDDGLACDFVERLQAVEPLGHPVAVYLTKGLIQSQKGVYGHEDRNNAFCSVLAPWTNPATCWADWHNLLGQSMPVIRLRGKPAWLQVVHGTNVSNRVRGRRVSPAEYQPQFRSLLVDAPIPTRIELLEDVVLLRPVRQMREVVRGVAKLAIKAASGRDGIDSLKALGASRLGVFQSKSVKGKV